MHKKTLQELALAARDGKSEHLEEYMAGVAEVVYHRPGHFGFRSNDEVGEAFCHYWSRIEMLPDNYLNAGSSFEAYLASSLRYIALSIRRSWAKDFDKESVCFEDRYRAHECGYSYNPEMTQDCGVSWPVREKAEYNPLGITVPDKSDSSIFAKALRIRLIYLCIKCATLLEDSRIFEIAKMTGVDPYLMMYWIQAARLGMSKRSIRTIARRQGRDSAWVRLNINRKRLSREVDPYRRQLLKSRIDKDRGVHIRACQVIHHSRSMLPNKQVAEIPGVSKGTVDSGVSRILKKFLPLYTKDDDC
jgi:hypothetical protein